MYAEYKTPLMPLFHVSSVFQWLTMTFQWSASWFIWHVWVTHSKMKSTSTIWAYRSTHNGRCLLQTVLHIFLESVMHPSAGSFKIQRWRSCRLAIFAKLDETVLDWERVYVKRIWLLVVTNFPFRSEHAGYTSSQIFLFIIRHHTTFMFECFCVSEC